MYKYIYISTYVNFVSIISIFVFQTKGLKLVNKINILHCGVWAYKFLKFKGKFVVSFVYEVVEISR